MDRLQMRRRRVFQPSRHCLDQGLVGRIVVATCDPNDVVQGTESRSQGATIGIERFRILPRHGVPPALITSNQARIGWSEKYQEAHLARAPENPFHMREIRL